MTGECTELGTKLGTNLEQEDMMDEFEKWLVQESDRMAAVDAWESGRCSFAEDALDKYRSMTCKMEYIDGLYSAFKCSACGELCNEDCAESPRYCPNCGRMVNA